MVEVESDKSIPFTAEKLTLHRNEIIENNGVRYIVQRFEGEIEVRNATNLEAADLVLNYQDFNQQFPQASFVKRSST